MLVDSSKSCRSLKFFDTITLRGWFRAFILEYDDNGNLINQTCTYDNHNVITLLGRKVMPHMLGDCESLCIDQFKIGADQSVDKTTMLNPPEPTESDTELLYHQYVFTRNRGDIVDGQPAFQVTYPNSPNETSVLFTFFIDRTEANLAEGPTIYLCAGLFVSSYGLFAQQTFPAMLKTSRVAFKFEWEILF